MNDWSELQAREWVKRELASLTTPEARAARLAHCKRTVWQARRRGLHKLLPNNFKAHELLKLILERYSNAH